MRRILLVILLIVFSVQGLTVAAGGGVLPAHAVYDENREKQALDNLQSQVDADVEEMSDYVAQAPASPMPARQAMRVSLQIPSLVSIDLARAPPPPRA